MSTLHHNSYSDSTQETDSHECHFSAITIAEFCERYNISTSTFYRNSKKMPKTVFIGKHPRILFHDEQKWLMNLPEDNEQD